MYYRSHVHTPVYELWMIHSGLYTGNACRYKVVGSLVKKFPSPREAEAHYFPSLKGSPSSSQSLSQMSTESQTESPPCTPKCTVAVQTGAFQPLHSEQCQTQLSLPPSIDDDDELLVLSKLFSELMMREKISIPDNYLLYSAKAMVQLSKHGRSNVLYNLAKGIGTFRQDGSDSCFHVNVCLWVC